MPGNSLLKPDELVQYVDTCRGQCDCLTHLNYIVRVIEVGNQGVRAQPILRAAYCDFVDPADLRHEHNAALCTMPEVCRRSPRQVRTVPAKDLSGSSQEILLWEHLHGACVVTQDEIDAQLGKR